MERIHRPPEQPTPTSSAPSCAARILTAAAAVLDREGKAHNVTEATLRRAVTAAVVDLVRSRPTLPSTVVSQALRRAWAAIPPGINGNTNGVQARVLRGVARRLS
ncbi:hypothetical protein AB0I84_05985 [Streptomyces spectabilis]|uniref:hypothetical protein n=1 Tax=Streptomyces spectabilis TaxID=68270 RepID=UPI0034017598